MYWDVGVIYPCDLGVESDKVPGVCLHGDHERWVVRLVLEHM